MISSHQIWPYIVSYWPYVLIIALLSVIDPNNNDRLENVQLKIVIGDVTSDTIEVKWNPVEAQRIKGYIIFYRVAGNSLFIEKEVMSNTAMNFVLKGLKQNTRYEIQMMAESQGYQSNTSPLVEMTTLRSKCTFSHYLTHWCMTCIHQERMFLHKSLFLLCVCLLCIKT